MKGHAARVERPSDGRMNSQRSMELGPGKEELSLSRSTHNGHGLLQLPVAMRCGIKSTLLNLCKPITAV